MPYLDAVDKELEIGDQVSLDVSTPFNVAVIIRFDSISESFDCEFADGTIMNVVEALVRENLTGKIRKQTKFNKDVVDVLTDI